MGFLRLIRLVFVLTLLFPNTFVSSVVTTLSDLDVELANFVDNYFDKQALIPIQTVGTTMAVTVDFDLVSIVDVDDDWGFVTVAGYLTIIWTEERYTTIADDIDISVSASAIWTPPLMVVNTLSYAATIGTDDDIVKFNLNTAQVKWKPWLQTKIACESDYFFPFDQQECSIKIASHDLTETEMSVAVTDATIGTAEFVENGLWKQKSTAAANFTVGMYPYAEFKFTIKREAQYLTFIVVCPLVIISIVHLFVFLIPLQQRAERSNFSIISIIGVLVALLWAMTYMPSNSVPVSILVYYLFSEFLINVAVMITVLFIMDKLKACECCTESTCFGNLVPTRKSEIKPSDQDDSGLRSESRHDNATARDVHVSEVMSAWEEEDFEEKPNTADNVSEKKSDNTESHGCVRTSVKLFLLFLSIHLCFTIAFLVPLGLNAE